MKHVYKRQRRTKKDEGKINFVNVNVMNPFLLFYLLSFNKFGQHNGTTEFFLDNIFATNVRISIMSISK
jgi:hypothetical protein